MLTILNNQKTSNDYTVVVLGCPRGGTSMITGVLMHLGINMGTEQTNNYQFEDGRFTKRDIDQQMKQAVKDMNNQFNRWGFKYPNNIYYINKLEPLLRNPRYIAVFRNNFAIARSSATRDQDKTYEDIPRLISLAHGHESKVSNFSNQTNYPIALFSFEEALAKPKEFVGNVINFFDITTSQSNIDKAIEWINADIGYRNIKTEEQITW